MKGLLIFYLVITTATFAYVGGVCLTKRKAPASGILGLAVALLGAALALAQLV